jgi:flagellar biosynthesis protein FlhF
MAFRRSSPRFASPPSAPPRSQREESLALQQGTALAPAESKIAAREWPSDETAFLRELLRCHGVSGHLLERLMEIATAPPNAARVVDRLAVALAAQLHFIPLEDVLQTPTLLYGAPGTGVSTLAAKLAARFEERQILVVSTDARGGGERAQLEEYLEVLGLPLAVATDAATLRSTVASADGRKVIIDTACGAPTEQKCAEQIRKLAEAAGAEPMLVLAADAAVENAQESAAAAARIGTRRMIVTRLDAERYVGSVLVAADVGKLALVAASVTPHFAFGLRTLTPENLARRLMAAALRAERWRIAPL